MIGLVLALATAAPPPRQSIDKVAAAAMLRAVIVAIESGKATVSCFPSPHYADAEPCAVLKASIPSLDLGKLTWFSARPCGEKYPQTLCAGFTFDRGLADNSRTTLLVSADSTELNSATDVTVHIVQGLATSD